MCLVAFKASVGPMCLAYLECIILGWEAASPDTVRQGLPGLQAVGQLLIVPSTQHQVLQQRGHQGCCPCSAGSTAPLSCCPDGVFQGQVQVQKLPTVSTDIAITLKGAVCEPANELNEERYVIL